MANPHRGEVEITLAGKTWTMRPTFQALCEIEDKTGAELTTLARQIWDGEGSVKATAIIVSEGIRACHANGPDLNAVGEAIVSEGLNSVLEPVVLYLVAAITGSTPDLDAARKSDGKAGGSKKA